MSSKHLSSQNYQPNISGFSQFKPSAALNRFLDNLSPDLANSFSQEQLIAIQAIFQRRKHFVDIRFSVPLIWTKFYIVFLLGPERRSSARLKADRSHYPIWTTANLLFVMGFISFSLVLMIGLFNLNVTKFKRFSRPKVHPASIPFKATQAECEKSGRIWQNGECIDYGHSPQF